MASVEALRVRLEELRASIDSAHIQSETLAAHVAEVTQLVDGAATRHAAWESRLASMVESDTRRSAEVAQKQETLAAALGIRPRGASNPLWRLVQHFLLFIGLVFSVVFVSPFSALKRWKENRKVTAIGSRSNANSLRSESARNQLSKGNSSAAATKDTNITETTTASHEEAVMSTNSPSIIGAEQNGRLTEATAREDAEAERGTLPVLTSNAAQTLTPSALTQPALSNVRRRSRGEDKMDTKDANRTVENGGRDVDNAENKERGPGTKHGRRLSWADRSHLLGVDMDYTSDDGGEVGFWNTFDT